MQTTEQRLERLEKHNKRLTTPLTVMVVAMCAVLTMAATHDKESVFDSVAAYTPDDPAWYAVVLSWLTSRRSPRRPCPPTPVASTRRSS